MDKENLLKQLSSIEHALEEAKHGVHNSQEWIEPWTGVYANGHDCYADWIDAEFNKLREMIKSDPS